MGERSDYLDGRHETCAVRRHPETNRGLPAVLVRFQVCVTSARLSHLFVQADDEGMRFPSLSAVSAVERVTPLVAMTRFACVGVFDQGIDNLICFPFLRSVQGFERAANASVLRIARVLKRAVRVQKPQRKSSLFPCVI